MLANSTASSVLSLPLRVASAPSPASRAGTSLLATAGRRRLPFPHQVRYASTQQDSSASAPSLASRDSARVSAGTGAGPSSSGPGGMPKVSTTFIVLSSLGVLATGYGVWEYYQSLNAWPRELRDDLRNALLARDRGDTKRASDHFKKVLLAARGMVGLPSSPLGSNPTLKTSGIAIAYAAMLERDGALDEAYKVYAEALDEVLLRGNFAPEDSSTSTSKAAAERAQGSRQYEKVRSPEERMRAVAIAQRLGDLALRPEVRDQLVNAGQWNSDPAEEHLKWSVEELLRLVNLVDTKTKTRLTADKEDAVLLSDLSLPPWVSTTDLGASLEALGAFYASRSNVEYAVPLFLQALALLLPPTKPSQGADKESGALAAKLNGGASRPEPTASDRCHAGVIMNNLAQLFVQVSDSSPLRQAPSSAGSPQASPIGSMEQGLAWASKGLEIVQSTQARCGWVDSERDGVGVSLKSTGQEEQDRVRAECARAQVTLLYNLGLINEMSKDVPAARHFFQRAYAEAERYGFRDARSRSAQGLARLERLKRKGSSSSFA
ncbi:hypothetical protein CF326_g6774 [Tilletia indica]|nr:hypothetical protein CF326_g6774 [Tilletia indica]